MSRRLVDAMPEFAEELRGLLVLEPDLAASVSLLKIIDICDCGESDCATFYTMSKPNGSWGLGLEVIPLEPKNGMLVLDVVQREIALVEVLNRPDVKAGLDMLTI